MIAGLLLFGLFVYLVIGACAASAVVKVYLGEDSFGDVPLKHAIYVVLSFLFWPITIPSLWSVESLVLGAVERDVKIFAWKNVRPDGTATVAVACGRNEREVRDLINAAGALAIGTPLYTGDLAKPLVVNLKVDVSDA